MFQISPLLSKEHFSWPTFNRTSFELTPPDRNAFTCDSSSSFSPASFRSLTSKTNQNDIIHKQWKIKFFRLINSNHLINYFVVPNIKRNKGFNATYLSEHQIERLLSETFSHLKTSWGEKRSLLHFKLLQAFTSRQTTPMPRVLFQRQVLT